VHYAVEADPKAIEDLESAPLPTLAEHRASRHQPQRLPTARR
jgi:hypothetical protein